MIITILQKLVIHLTKNKNQTQFALYMQKYNEFLKYEIFKIKNDN